MEQVVLKQVNAMPLRTMEHLRANGGSVAVPARVPAAFQGARRQSGAGVEFTPLCSGGVELAEGDIVTGMGAETREYVKAHRNAGCLIEIPKGAKAASPAVLCYTLDPANPALVDENIITAGEGSRATVVLRYGGAGFHAGLTRVFVRPGAHVTLVLVQLLGGESPSLDDIGAVVAPGGSFRLVQAELGGNAWAGCHTLLKEEAKLEIAALYLGDGRRSADINYTATQEGRRSESAISVHGALFDESSKLFRGTIDFKRGAAGARGREEEVNVLVGSRVRSRTVPVLLCAEEDVDGQHAATTGRLDAEKLFYLESRGLSEKDAEKLMVRAAFAPVTALLPLPGLREEVATYIEERIDAVEPVR